MGSMFLRKWNTGSNENTGLSAIASNIEPIYQLSLLKKSKESHH